MSTFTIISIIVNIGLIILCLSLVYPKAIQLYRNRQKLRESNANKVREQYIRKVVREYLEELKND